MSAPEPGGGGEGRTAVRVLSLGSEPARARRVHELLAEDVELLATRDPQELLALFEQHRDIAVVLVSDEHEEWDAVELLEACARLSPMTRRVLISPVSEGARIAQAVNRAQLHYLAASPLQGTELLAALRRLAGDYLEEATLRRQAARVGGSRPKDGTLANKDPLTGLYNHRSFQERFREELSRARRYCQSISILHGDLDHFRALNRTAGFRCGDEVLQRIASVLRAEQSSVRQSDITARFGGQEFALLLPETDKEGARIKAERLREAVSDSALPDGMSTTISFGVATFPDDGQAPMELLNAAANSLKRAKKNGRNRVESQLDEQSDNLLERPNVHALQFSRLHACMGELVHAIERDRNLSCLYVDLSRLRRIEREFGIAQHAQLFARAGELLAKMRGDKLRRDDLLCRTDDADGYLCFMSPPRVEDTPPIDLSKIAKRVTTELDEGLSEAMSGLTRDRAQVAVGMARILNNPMIRGERLVHRLIDEARQSAELEWRRTSQQHKAVLQEIVITRQLRTAFQPIVDLHSGKHFAFEALTRGPVGSPLAMPATLFSVADAVDLTIELDRACFATALRNAQGCNPGHRLFLNLLPASFYDTHFIEKGVVDMLDRVGLTPANLVFEITEKLAIENFSAFRQALKRYTDMGFWVAVDDVGTRHSNLEAVMALQPHFIKLSDILCRGVTQSTVKREMVRSLVRIANTIGAHTVAEGIEGIDDLITLQDLGVRFAQGYYLARPDFCFPELTEAAQQFLSKRLAEQHPAPIADELEAITSPVTKPIL